MTATTGTVTIDTAPRTVDADAPPAAGYAAPFVWVNVDHANVRATPNLKAIVFVSEPRDTKLALLGTVGSWTHVETHHGITGWMMTALIRSSP